VSKGAHIFFGLAILAAIAYLYWQHRQANPSPVADNTDVMDLPISSSAELGGAVGPAFAAANISYLYPPPLSAMAPVVAR
jgi:hypothetical protein